MKNNPVGKIKNIKINCETDELEFTVVVQNNKFKKQLLRDLNLAGQLLVEDGKIIFISKDEEGDA